MKRILLSFTFVLFTTLAMGQGYSLSFDGTDDYVDCGNNASVQLSGTTITLEAWIYPTAFGTTSQDNSIIAKDTDAEGGAGTNTAGYVLSCGANGAVSFSLGLGGETWVEVNSGDNAITLNTWNHIAAVYNGSNMLIYINGIETASEILSAAFIANTSSNLFLGSSQQNDTRDFQGLIDEVRIWSNARTDAEIRANLNREITGTEDYLAAYYQMSDGSGTSLTDDDASATNGGTISDATWSTSDFNDSFDNALNFDGIDDYVYATAPWTTRDGTSTYTITAWIKPSYTNDPGDAYEIISLTDNSNPGDGDNATDYAGFRIPKGSKTLEFGIDNGEGWTNVVSNTALTAEVWHHVALVVNGTTITFYLNGINDGGGTIGSRALDGLDIVSIGAAWLVQGSDETEVKTDFFEGEIDEVAIYNDIRTQDEIRAFMCQELTPIDDANLVAYYKFDGNVNDYTTSGNNGTLVNGGDGSLAYGRSLAFNTWTGASDNNWSLPANWSQGGPPAGESVGFYNGAGNYPVIANGTSFRNLFIENSATPSFGGNFTASGNVFFANGRLLPSNENISTVSGDLIIYSGASVTMSPGSKLTVEGNLENSGTLALNSTDGSSAASLITGTVTNNGTITVRRYIPASTIEEDDYSWHSIGLPVTTGTAGDYFTGDYLLKYNESNNSWSNIHNLSTNLPFGTGYLLKTTEAGGKTYDYTGDLNNGNIQLTLTNSSSDADHGYNLVSNPYPSAIDLDLIALDGLSNIDDSYWVWNGVDNYLAYESGVENQGKLLEPGQAFFVKVSEGFATGTLTFENEDRLHNNNGTFYKKSTSTGVLEKIRLEAKNETGEDAVFICHRDKKNTTIKFFSMKSTMPQVYVNHAEKDYAIFNQKEITGQTVIPIGYYSETLGNTTLKITENSLDAFEILLRDKKTGNETSFTEEGTSYAFTHENFDASERFELVFTPSGTTGLSNEQPSAKIRWYEISSQPEGMRITITNTPRARAEVYNILGSKIQEIKLIEGQNYINFNQSGSYFVRVSSEYGTIQEKYIFLK